MSTAAASAPALRLAGLGAPLLLVAMLAMIVVPLAPLALDLLFTFNIALSLLVILMAVYTPRPLEFAVFPTVLLVATLLRLALNIASTRVVLLHGHTGTDAAGRVIEAFGGFVVGSSYTVGLVIFAILVIINFVVVTKGATRVSEVNARFTLDAMPGKQMAIDADLNAGVLSQEEARQRREEVGREADFYGSMDGASKFVRGDAVAGILILVINIVGGLIIGTATHGMPLAHAAQNYVLLTIGDGLVAQLPSLMLSSATAIIVTRVSSPQDMGQQVVEQLFDNPRALYTAAAIVGILGLVPGMPKLVFLLLGGALFAFAYFVAGRRGRTASEAAEAATPPASPEQRELSWDDVPPVDLVSLELGYRLVPLVDREQGGALLARIKGVRRKLSQELGFLIQPVHIRDNLELAPTGYRISLLGVAVGDADVQPERELAINPGRVYGKVAGEPTREPAFGLEAVWIDPVDREHAQSLGYTVVDPATVVATHLSRALKEHAHELLGHEEVQQLLDLLKRGHPNLVESLTPKVLEVGVVLQVLQNLLAEEVPVRDMRTIAETLAQRGRSSQDPDALTAAVRAALGRSIVQNIAHGATELPLIALDPSLEQILQQVGQAGTRGVAAGPAIEPGLAERVEGAVREVVQRQEMGGEPSVLVVSPDIRPWVARWLRARVRGLHVLAYTEIPDSQRMRIVATVGRPESAPAAVAGPQQTAQEARQ